jgi:hypothetical protein
MSRPLAMILAAALCTQAPLARAEIVETEALGAQSQAELDRAKVRSFMERADVKERLQTMGVGGLVAGDRVASLTDAEVHAMAQRIDAMPAGGALTNQDWVIILLVAILVAILL